MSEEYLDLIEKLHKTLDDASVPCAKGVVCDDPECNSLLQHRIGWLIAELAAERARKARGKTWLSEPVERLTIFLIKQKLRARLAVLDPESYDAGRITTAIEGLEDAVRAIRGLDKLRRKS